MWYPQGEGYPRGNAVVASPMGCVYLDCREILQNRKLESPRASQRNRRLSPRAAAPPAGVLPEAPLTTYSLLCLTPSRDRRTHFGTAKGRQFPATSPLWHAKDGQFLSTDDLLHATPNQFPATKPILQSKTASGQLRQPFLSAKGTQFPATGTLLRAKAHPFLATNALLHA